MNTDRFKNYDPDVRELVLAFESEGEGGRRFFDVDELEVIADYYLEVNDVEGFESAVKLGERLYPQSSSIRLRKAQLLGVRGSFSKALHLLKQLEQDEPDNTDISYLLGTLYSATGQFKESIECYLHAATDGYDLGTVYGNVAEDYVKLNNNAQAVRYYRKALIINPEEDRLIYGLANIWDRQRRDLQAQRFFSHHVEEHPYCKAAWFCLGDAYMALELYEKAADAFEYAIAIDKTFDTAYIHLSFAYRHMGDLTNTVRALRDALDYAYDRSEVLATIADAYKEAGNYHTATVYLQQALKEDPSRGYMWHQLGECSEHLGYIDEAVGYYNRAINLSPDYDPFWISLADLYIRQDRYAEGASLLESALPESTLPCPFEERLAYCYFKLGRRSRLFSLLRELTPIYGTPFVRWLTEYPDMAKDSELLNYISHLNTRNDPTPE